MIYLAITLSVLGFITLTASIFVASYLFGENNLLKKSLVEAKRREKRLHRENFLCHNVIAKKAGFGSLLPQPVLHSNTDNKSTGVKIVSPREKIAEMQKEPKVLNNQVPPAIKEKFLKEV